MTHTEKGTRMDTIETLGQTKFWTTATGDKVKRKKMATAHKASTLAWLIRNSANIVNRYASNSAFDYCPDEVSGELDHMQRDPEGWMLQQVFVKALIADLANAAGLATVEGVTSAAKYYTGDELNAEYDRGLADGQKFSRGTRRSKAALARAIERINTHKQTLRDARGSGWAAGMTGAELVVEELARAVDSTP